MDKPVKKSNELIRRRKRKMVIRRSLLASILLIAVFVTLALKLPNFNIKTINIINNKNVKAEIIEELSGIGRGNNIFYINSKRAKSNIITNPYIYSVNIIRKLPYTIIIDVKEREAVFYINENNKYFIIDEKGIILEIRDNIDNFKLVRIDGLSAINAEAGKIINVTEERQLKLLTEISDLVKRNMSGITFDAIDVSDVTNIKIYSSNLYFKIGDIYDLQTKLNKALNIAAKDEVKGKKGYIDVSFSGNPVLHIE